MPQITVTLDDDVYFDLTHNLPKGLKSKFVNLAIKKAILHCGGFGNVMHAYAKRGEHVAHEVLNHTIAANNLNQIKLAEWTDKNIEAVETKNEKWIREQKEALE